MKILVLALSLSISGVCYAASPEQSYLAARDAVIKRLTESRKRGVPDKQLTEQHKRALTDLQKRLRAVVGPSTLKGFPAFGTINLEGLLQGDQDFGLLDGLVYASKDEKTRIVVTTESLFKSWLRAHRNWWAKQENVPQDIEKALKWASFYTQALSTDAAVGQFAEIPVTKPAQASFAYAMLAARAQDVGPRTPTELLVSVIRGQRIFIVSAAAEVEIKPMKECDAIWQVVQKKSEESFEAYRQSGLKDESVLDRQHKLEEESDDAFRRCYAERVPRDAGFKTLLAQAQAIVDSLPAK